MTAIQRGARGTFVYVATDEGTVSVRNVRAGAVDGEWTSVEGDLKEGEKVVTDGADRLREGARVEAITPPKPAARGPRGPGAPGGAGKGDKGQPRPPAAVQEAAEAQGGEAAGSGSKSESKPAPQPDRKSAAKSAPGASSATPSGSAPENAQAVRRPPFFDKLSPEMQERFLKMSPEERRQFVERIRERRAAGKGGAGEKGPANPQP